MTVSAVISASESTTIDNTMDDNKPPDFDKCMITNNSCDNIHAVLSSISSIYDPVKLHGKLLERRNVGVFAASIGSTTVGSTSPYVLDVDTIDSENDSEINNDKNNDATVTEWDHDLIDKMDINLDAMISSVGATTATKPKGVTAKHLSKVWRIDTKTAKKTLDVTTQLLR